MGSLHSPGLDQDVTQEPTPTCPLAASSSTGITSTPNPSSCHPSMVINSRQPALTLPSLAAAGSPLSL